MKSINISDRVFNIFNIAFMLVIALIFIMPMITVLSTSFVSMSEAARRGSYVLIPENFDFSAYKALLSNQSFLLNGYKITFLRVIIGTLLNLMVTSTLAYGLSRKGLPGNGFFTTIIFFTMLFGGGLVPNYLVVKAFGLIDTFWAMIIPGLVGVWYIIIMRAFFWQIPESLEEAATIDGASEFRIFTSIYLPLSIPSIATIGMFYAVGHWNAWFDAAIYISDYKLQPLQLFLRGMVNSASNQISNEAFGGDVPPSETIKCATIILATAPILAIYPFVQKYFVKGMMMGAVKG